MNADDLGNITARINSRLTNRRSSDQDAATSGAIQKVENSGPLKVGSILNRRFVLKEVIGSGGMGTVFRATDLHRLEAQGQQTDVALKVLNEEFRDDPELFIMLQRETKKSQMLAHPNIVSVYDFDRDGRNIFMVMEMLEGKPLSHYIQEIARRGGIPFDKAWPIIEGMALALGYAHKKNIVHSDFKPSNIFITYSGEVKVLDFGIACAAVKSKHQSYEVTVFNPRNLEALTPAYASLEMFENCVPDPRDDVYALACVSYELLAGRHPFSKLLAQKALEINLQPPAIPGLKRRQWNALTHALALRREQRTTSIAQFLDEIRPKPAWSGVPGTAAVKASTHALALKRNQIRVSVRQFFSEIKSRLLRLNILGVVTVTALIAAGGYVYIYPSMNAASPVVVELTSEQQLQIKDLLELAQIHFDVGYITEPQGSNALWTYRRVLAIDPDNREALQGLEKIADLIEEQANELFAQQKFEECLAKIEEGLKVQPKKDRLLSLKEQILKTRR
ncbi:serine/threonine-protein kinase [Methylobacter sp. YRD-M1]|uniref:serine/threonine-protein kinase n=1 Tax=Methylobacter sp. YRD-M1 TaxID=2911520 RepID=UPI00227CEB4F|nr:serine/threonine-protein kinase [Methylobacter sp. YRD-M1]WAK00347.1 serine/threonine protein kinase [Methylobacter sp. YRD-M1]